MDVKGGNMEININTTLNSYVKHHFGDAEHLFSFELAFEWHARIEFGAQRRFKWKKFISHQCVGASWTVQPSIWYWPGTFLIM